MKSNELFEQIHSGKIKENTRIEVKNEDGKVLYQELIIGRKNCERS